MLMRRIWEEWEDKLLVDRYATTPTIELADRLGRSINSLYGRAGKLGIRKCEQFFKDSEMNPRLKKFIAGGKKSHFKKGRTPENKGRKQKEYMTQEAINRTKATRFQKGDRPVNWKPVGSTRINVDGYVEVKVKEPRTWKLQHRVLWEEHHGKIPKAHAVVFKNNNSLDIRIDNLELITLADNMRRNTLHRYPEDVVRAIRTQGKLENLIYGKDRSKMERERKRVSVKKRVDAACKDTSSKA